MGKATPMKKSCKTPRFGPLAIAQILLLRNKGESFPAIAKAPFVRKKDGTRPTQQAVAKQCKTKTLQKRKGTWAPKQGQGAGGGRPKKLTEAQKAEVGGLVKKHRFNRVCVGMFRTYRRGPFTRGKVHPVVSNNAKHAPRGEETVARAERRRSDA